MIKTLAAIPLAFALAAAPADAFGPKDDGAKDLRNALRMVVSNEPPGQSKRPDDPDQGDDNASLKAINEVCTKDTPAADRSAICDRNPASPQ